MIGIDASSTVSILIVTADLEAIINTSTIGINPIDTTGHLRILLPEITT